MLRNSLRPLFMSLLVAAFGRRALGRQIVPAVAFVSPASSCCTTARQLPLTRKSLWLLAERLNDNKTPPPGINNKVEPTWSYVPYDNKSPPTNRPRPPPRRNFSTSWNVPKKVDIPEDQLEINFVRSSGSGGQNVNKLSTKVELRMHVASSQWIPEEVRQRVLQQQANRISKEGILTLTSQEHRTQGQNRKAALNKLEQMLLEAWPRPKVRKQRKGPSRAAKVRNKEFKKRRSDTKSNRGKVDW